MLKISQKIFNPFFLKSGTTSLTKAMQILGFRSIHNASLEKIIRENNQLNKKLLLGISQFDFYSDFGGRFYYQRLDIQYPKSKFIFTARDLNTWLISVQKHLKKKKMHVDREKLKNQYETILNDALFYFQDRPSDYLIMRLDQGDGWCELCNFLQVSIPKVAFPFLNKTRD